VGRDRVLVLATKYFEGALDARPVSAILGPNRSEAAMSLLRSPAIALVCLSLLMTHQASAKTVSFIYFTVEVPNDWSLDPARANNILSGDRSILMVAANAVKIGPPTEQRGQNNDDSLPLDLVEKYKKLDPLGQKIEPIDDYSTRKINDRRLLVHRAYRMNPSTIVVLYYVVAPNYIVTITVTSKRSIDAMHAVMEPIIASLNWLDDAQAQEQDDLAPLRAEISRLLGQGKSAQAVPIAQRYVEQAHQKHGEQHPEFAIAITRLAGVYRAQGRLVEAEPLVKRALAIIEKTLGPEHPEVGAALNNLAELCADQGRLAEAEPLHRRSVVIREKALGPHHPDVGTSLNSLALLYVNQGRYPEAEQLFRRSLAISEKALGPEHPSVGTALNNLAGVYWHQSRLAEAEPLYRRSLTIREKTLGPGHPEVGITLDGLAVVYRAQGRLAEAEPLHQRSLAIAEKALGAQHPQVATTLNNLAELYRDHGRYAEAEPLHKRSLAIREKVLGPQHPLVGSSLNNLALLYQAQGRLAEVEPLHRRSLAIAERVLGPDHPQVGAALDNLAALYRDQSRLAEAEPLFRRSLAIAEKALGGQHPRVATALNNLAELYRAQGRDVETEPLYRRSLAITEKALGPDHPDVASTLNNLAALYRDQGRLAEVEPLQRRSLVITEKALGPDHPDVARSLGNLGSVQMDRGRLAEAEALYRRSLAVAEKALGPEHPSVGTALSSLAVLYAVQGRYADAEPLFRRNLAIREKALGPDHPDVAGSLSNLAGLALAQGDWDRAADYLRRGTGVIQRRAESAIGGRAEGSSNRARRQSSSDFTDLVKMVQRLAAEGRAPGAPAAEMFDTAQWALASEAAASLAQMAARSAAGASDLAVLVRERQDLAGEWQAKDKLLIAAKSQEPGKRNAGAEKALADRLGAIDARLAEIGRKLAKDFPDYAALAIPVPAPVAEVQRQLRPDEALVLFLDTPERALSVVDMHTLPEETFVWVVTKSEVRWLRSELGTAALQREVAALRCGLDGALWDDVGKAQRCFDLVKTHRHSSGPYRNVLPFDLGRAHALYKALLGPVEDLIKGKHLLIVPSGALTQLPFQVLVTEAPRAALPEAPAEYRDAAWLGARQPIAVLPAVSSLKALRAHAKASRAGKAYLGIGNPLLDGDRNDANDVARAKLARTRQACAAAPIRAALAPAAPVHGGMSRVAMRGALADVAAIKDQVPLPETADELCRVAAELKADTGEVRLGARATELEIKRLSTSGELSVYRVLHFATHGVMAGELSKDLEPGLLLTPPEEASEADDGYLSASEIAALKLDADWVVLSACNTAAGGASSAEALSGIARAFIYAGTRALLVSHWAVYSDATVKLVTKAAAEMAGDAKVGRAEAMRRAMRVLIEKGTPIEAHPAFWAPFVVVGEGAAAR
jgi:CHAT domain-containing protein/tetratricopeptide (TPR) repeat protein